MVSSHSWSYDILLESFLTLWQISVFCIASKFAGTLIKFIWALTDLIIEMALFTTLRDAVFWLSAQNAFMIRPICARPLPWINFLHISVKQHWITRISDSGTGLFTFDYKVVGAVLCIRFMDIVNRSTSHRIFELLNSLLTASLCFLLIKNTSVKSFPLRGSFVQKFKKYEWIWMEDLHILERVFWCSWSYLPRF